MTGGFNDPIIGGGGALVYPAIHSPNFVTGSAGWSINKNGTAEFNSLTVRNGTIISGVFLLYSSAIPAKGNLVVAFAPQAGGTDSVGNVYPQGFNFGTWDATTGILKQHFGINLSGDTFLANNAGNTIMHGRSSDGSLFFYNASGEGAGNLITSIAPAAGTDPPGDATQAGITSYLPGTPSTYVQLINQTLRFATAQSVILPNMTAAATATESHLQIGSGTGPEAGAVLSTLQLGDSGNNLPGLTVVAPDGNTYDTERLTLVVPFGASISINSAVIPVTIFTKHLGTGTYEIEVWLVTSNATAADAAQFAFAFSGTAAGALVDFQCSISGTATVLYAASATLTSTFNGQGFGGNQRVHMNLTVLVTVAGTLKLTGLELMAGNVVTVFGGSRMRICPVVAS